MSCRGSTMHLKRPKLAIEMPPQHGKSWSAEDFIAWIAGKQRSWKTIYASYSDSVTVSSFQTLSSSRTSFGLLRFQ
jgi:hypothetical protein